jgi:hypothetical protein
LLSLGCGAQSVNSKFSRRFNQRSVFAQIANEFWIRLHPPKSISAEDKMRRSTASQPLEILDCLFDGRRKAD